MTLNVCFSKNYVNSPKIINSKVSHTCCGTEAADTWGEVVSLRLLPAATPSSVSVSVGFLSGQLSLIYQEQPPSTRDAAGMLAAGAQEGLLCAGAHPAMPCRPPTPETCVLLTEAPRAT